MNCVFENCKPTFPSGMVRSHPTKGEKPDTTDWQMDGTTTEPAIAIISEAANASNFRRRLREIDREKSLFVGFFVGETLCIAALMLIGYLLLQYM